MSLFTSISRKAVIPAIALAISISPLHANRDWQKDYTGRERHSVVLLKMEDAPGARTTFNQASSKVVSTATYATEGVTTGIEGKFGKAFKIEELGEHSDPAKFGYLQISSAYELRWERMRELTVELWYSPLSENPAGTEKGYRYLVDNQYASKDGFKMYLTGGDNTLRVTLGNGEEYLTAITSPIDWQVGKWYHIAFTYTERNGELLVYLNGQIIGLEARKSFGNISSYQGNLRIGNRLGSHYGPLPGLYDNFRISDTKLDFRP